VLIGSVNIFDMAIFKFEMAVLARERELRLMGVERGHFGNLENLPRVLCSN
jgi:hypothetical protein